MFRIITTAIAAAVLTTGAVAALADTANPEIEKITVTDSGDYCLRYRPLTGSLIAHQECHSKAEWAKDGVSFSR
jgi:hypothetical protein